VTERQALSWPEDPFGPAHERQERDEFWRRARAGSPSIRDMGTDPIAWAGRWSQEDADEDP
jgi:hypothetical protein